MRHISFCAAVLAALSSGLATSSSVAQERDGFNTWIKRPWEIRYVLFVETTRGWKYSQSSAKKDNATPGQKYFRWKEFFDPTSTIPMPDLRAPAPNNAPEDKVVVAMTLDKDGFVTSPHTHPGPLRGRLNEIMRIVLSAGDGVADRTYRLGHWFLGLNEDTPLEVTPALCNEHDMPGPFSDNPESYLYHSEYKPSRVLATGFGCREWSYQLQTSSRPYIDVTSYVPKPKKGDKTPYKHGSYIGDVVGWGNFYDKKPVIGKHADTWYCLYECPGDDKPGKIDDINAWAARNGWKPPKPPTRMPVFVDDSDKRGRYPE